jgi:hypothetical protein
MILKVSVEIFITGKCNKIYYFCFMNHLFRCLVMIMIAVTTGSCIRGHREKERKPLIFTEPAIPVLLTSDSDVLKFRALHYWDLFPFEDSLCIQQKDFAAQAFTGFVDLLQQNPLQVGETALKNMMNRAGTAADDPLVRKKVLHQFFTLSEYFFYHPNSPYRNDDFFRVVLEYMVSSPLPDTMDKQRPVYLLKMIRKNRVGELAADIRFVRAVRNFPYTDNPAQQETLYGLKSDYVLLFFINLGCTACRKAADEILASALLTEMVKKKNLAILTVYPDKDLEGWQKYLPTLPPDWIHAYDPEGEIRNGSTYDLKAIPSLYLLDSSKRVLVKDALSVSQIEDTIRQEAHFL